MSPDSSPRAATEAAGTLVMENRELDVMVVEVIVKFVVIVIDAGEAMFIHNSTDST